MDTTDQKEKGKAMAISTACRTHRRAKQSKPSMRNAVGGTTQRRIRRKRRELMKKMKKEKQNRAGVEMRIRALQRIVPGGETVVGVDKLFEQTADYILELQTQVKAMKVLATFFEGLEREKMKFGG